MSTVYFDSAKGKVLSDKEAKNYVRWHLKGCASCKPIIVETRPLTERPKEMSK